MGVLGGDNFWGSCRLNEYCLKVWNPLNLLLLLGTKVRRNPLKKLKIFLILITFDYKREK